MGALIILWLFLVLSIILGVAYTLFIFAIYKIDGGKRNYFNFLNLL